MYVRQVLRTSAYTFTYMLATGCAYALMYVQFIHSALGNEDGGDQLVNESKDRGVLCIFSIFMAGGGKSGYMCVYTHTNTRCQQAH